jgi:hypothetical protein
MSWAAKRQTKREEDLAYCLLGLFDINMPMLYGEGAKVFLRLQEEIIKQYPDMSIFAWMDPERKVYRQEYSGFLAESPRLFAHAGDIALEPVLLHTRTDFSLTNRGIRFHEMYLGREEDPSEVLILPLGHKYASQNQSLGVFMQPIGLDTFVRQFPHKVAAADRILTVGSKETSFLAHRTLSAAQGSRIAETHLTLKTPSDLHHYDFMLVEVEPYRCWSPLHRKFYGGYDGLFFGYFRFNPEWAETFDFYVIVVSYNISKENKWRHALVRGERWLQISQYVLEYYQENDHELSAKPRKIDLLPRIIAVNAMHDSPQRGLTLFLPWSV